jgi:hypothetical protein
MGRRQHSVVRGNSEHKWFRTWRKPGSKVDTWSCHLCASKGLVWERVGPSKRLLSAHLLPKGVYKNVTDRNACAAPPPLCTLTDLISEHNDWLAYANLDQRQQEPHSSKKVRAGDTSSNASSGGDGERGPRRGDQGGCSTSGASSNSGGGQKGLFDRGEISGDCSETHTTLAGKWSSGINGSPLMKGGQQVLPLHQQPLLSPSNLIKEGTSALTLPQLPRESQKRQLVIMEDLSYEEATRKIRKIRGYNSVACISQALGRVTLMLR